MILTCKMVGRLYTSPGFPAGIPEAPLEDADAAKQLVAIPAFHIKSIAMYTSCVVQKVCSRKSDDAVLHADRTGC